MSGARSVHQAVVDAACAATDADQGWLLAATDAGLVVLAAFGGPMPASLVGTLVAVAGARGYAVSSGQPSALRPEPTDYSNAGAAGAPGVPGSVLAIPCGDDDVVGVIELMRRSTGGFSFDDVEMVSLFAEIAGAAIADEQEDLVSVTPPEQLSAELTSLAATNGRRYAQLAQMVESMLGQA